MDRLLDLQIQLPAIFEDGELLEGKPPTISTCLQAKALLEKCYELDRQFEDWYHRLQLCHDGIRYSVVSSPASANYNGIQPLAEEQYQFLDTKYAFLHIYYWAGKTLFYRAIQHIHTIASQTIPTMATRSTSMPSQPVFTPQPPIMQSQYIPIVTSNNNLGTTYSFAHDPLSFINNTLTTPAPFFFASNQHLQYTPSSEDLFHLHQEILDPETPLIPEPNPIPLFNFSIEVPVDVSATNFSDSPVSSSQFGSTTASFTPSSRSGTPARQIQSSALSSPALTYGMPHLNLNEIYIAPPPPLPTVSPLDKKYAESEVLSLVRHICNALPFTLASTITQMSTQPRSVTPSPSPTSARRASELSMTFSNASLSPPIPGYNLSVPGPQPAPTTVLSEFGPDAAIWPLETAMKVFRRQQRYEEHEWTVRTLKVLKKEGQEMAGRVRSMAWKEWR